ncbi:MAG TPA: RNA pseudouridine synthase [Candidatus Parabacteroides intestinavium]|nr:RNA pseudouridine synthase [Candidatus Parabacteroides intestinavium]
MTDTKLHRFQHATASIPMPDKFTYPFHYVPHPLCILAAQEVQTYLRRQTRWQEELQQGKMFGVLVVRTPDGTIGYLAAFSGNLAHSNVHDYFVPPVYDLLRPDGFFKQEEEQISAINRRIETLTCSAAYMQALKAYQEDKTKAHHALLKAKEELQSAKARRDEQRRMDLTEAQRETLVRESQFQKAEYKRLEKRWKCKLSERESTLKNFESEISRLKQERKTRSATLQRKLFHQFRMRNALGDEKDLCELFAHTPQQVPPAGAGECAAPKLLQYAYLHQLHPLAMAEFWWGNSPITEIRKQGNFYPACKGKCAPILAFMLQGLEVEENPLIKDKHAEWSPEIIYEDADLLVVNKPAGMLSVPGKEPGRSLIDRIQYLYPDSQEWMAVHRLDMATSGLLLLAKNKAVYQHLQAQFKNKIVQKRYVAWLDGIVSSTNGMISLPLSPDWMNRPRQMVNHTEGKPAQTRYEVLSRTDTRTRIAFYPLTGRTHQLRVHAASAEGLSTPIVGDELYGTPSNRLYLHAESLDFIHPRTGIRIHVEKAAPF